MRLDTSDLFLIAGILLVSVSLALWVPTAVPAYYGVMAILFGIARGIADARSPGNDPDQPPKR
ncbi:MAG: hypothetical protein EBT09_09155 [Actinobacteria bacterium]|jgi:hypothetical protein|nr:hypothetical protein [Actinomycetota bacterium]